MSSNIIGNNETSFPHKLLWTNREDSNLRKAFANNLSADIKLTKTQLSNMIQSGGFSIPLGLTAAASAADAGKPKKSEDQGMLQH